MSFVISLPNVDGEWMRAAATARESLSEQMLRISICHPTHKALKPVDGVAKSESGMVSRETVNVNYISRNCCNREGCNMSTNFVLANLHRKRDKPESWSCFQGGELI